MGKSLSHLAGNALTTQEANTTGVLTSILSIDPEDGTFLQFHNRVSTGDAAGLPVFMDLRDASGNQLPTDTELLIRVERPEDDEPTAVTVAENNIAAWNDMTTKEQRHSDNIDAVKLELKSSSVNVRDKDEMTVEINSSAQIDWANSELYFAREAVDEFPIER